MQLKFSGIDLEHRTLYAGYKISMIDSNLIISHILIYLLFFRFRKNFGVLLEEEQCLNPEGPNYLTIQAPASKLPERHLCAVCGFPAPYTCIPCGSRYCSIKCLSTHEDTRCLKYTA